MTSRRRFLADLLAIIVPSLSAGTGFARSAAADGGTEAPPEGGRSSGERPASGDAPSPRTDSEPKRSRPDGVSSASQRRAARKKRAKARKD